MLGGGHAETGENAEGQQQQFLERGRVAAAHVVTEEEAAAAIFSIDDVVLPLPGSQVQYPRHTTAQVSRVWRFRQGNTILLSNNCAIGPSQ